MADIWITDINKTKVIRFPTLPKDFPSLERNAKNEEFETFNNGIFNIPGNIGLTTFSLEGWMPDTPKKYPFCKSNNVFDDFYFLCKDAMYNKKPIHIILSKDKSTSEFNGLATIESFSWKLNKQLNYNYSVTFKEYKKIDINNLGVW